MITKEKTACFSKPDYRKSTNSDLRAKDGLVLTIWSRMRKKKNQETKLTKHRKTQAVEMKLRN